LNDKKQPRQKTVALRPETYIVLRRIATEDRRTLGATIARLLAAAEMLR
jgi:hypothetical protein